jgi:glycine C-acetyltransferase
LLDTAPRLAETARHLASVAASPAGHSFDRERLGAMRAHVVVGPPRRPDLGPVERPQLPAINLASCSYLGLADDPRIRNAALRALETYGTQAGGARPLSGTTRPHFDFEQSLARFLGAEATLTFSSGYLANVSTLVTLFGPGDLVVLDRHAHRSLRDGALLAGAHVRRFRHNDVRHLDLLLETPTTSGRRLVVVDGVYSMDGDVAPLPHIVEVVRKHDAFLMVDEAHSVGILGDAGRGITEHFGMHPAVADLRTGSLNKAIPAAGAFVAAQAAIVRLLRYTSAGGAFSGALAPASIMAAQAALEIIEKEPERISATRRNAEVFRALLQERGVDTLGSTTPIVPIRVGAPARTLAAASALLDRGIYLNAIIPPGVRRGTERLRCFVAADHAEADLRYAAESISQVLSEAR